MGQCPRSEWQVHLFDLADVFGHRKTNLAHLRQLRPDLELRSDSAVGRYRSMVADNLGTQDPLIDNFLRNLNN